MNSKPTNRFADLIEDFRDDGIRNALGPSFAILVPGNWKGLIAWAGKHGYTFDAADIQAHYARTPKLAAVIAATPQLNGWNPDSLAGFLAAERAAG
jgi:hypothetical protein